MEDAKKKSPWFYVGIGCLVAFILLLIAVAGIGYFGYRFARQVGDQMRDPVTRAAKVKDVLGAEELPPGYYPVLGLSIPFIMDMAILSDREGMNQEGPGFERRGFIYMNMRGGNTQQRELRDFFEGKSSDSRVFRQQSIRVRPGELIRRGEIQEKTRRLLYVTERGAVHMRGSEVEGVRTMFLVECPNDTRARFGIWFGPDPDPTTPVKSANFVGSPADEDELKSFAARFDFCRAQQ